MRVGQPDALVVQPARLNHRSQLTHPRYGCLRQEIQECKSLCAVLQRSQSQFCNDERVDNDLPLVEMTAEFLAARAQMIDPDRSVGENQSFPGWRRGIFFKRGIVPPKEASLRALSRSMSALRASRSKAVFSATPVNSWAVRTRSSSSAMVVLICKL